MKVKNAVIPNEEQMAGFVEGDIDTPIKMVNLLKFKDKFDGRKPAFGVIIPVAPRSGGLHIANVGLFQFFEFA